MMQTHEVSLTQRVLRGGVIVLFFSFLASPLGYAFRLLLSRTLSIEMYGLFYAVLALFAVLITYNDLGFGLSAAYFIPKFLAKGDKQSVWNIHAYDRYVELGTSVLLSTILFFSARWLSSVYFKNPTAEYLVYIFCIYFVTNSFVSSIQKLFLGLQKEHIYSSIQTSSLSFILIFSLFFWFFDIPRVIYYALAWSGAYLLTSAIYAYILYKKNASIILKTTWDKGLFKKMLVYALPTLFTTSIYTFIISTDVFFLTLFKTVREVGIYSVVMPIAAISGIFLYPINSFFFPLVSHLEEKDGKPQILHLMQSILKIVPLVTAYFGIFIFLFPGETIGLLFGKQWIELGTVPLMIAVVVSLFSSLSSYFTTIAAGVGLVKKRLHIAFFLAIINIILSSILVYTYGVIGAVVAAVLVQGCSVFLLGKAISHVISFRYPIVFYGKLVLFAALLFTLTRVFSLQPHTFYQYILFGGVYTCTALGFVFVSKPFNQRIFDIILSARKEKPSPPPYVDPFT